MEETLSDLERSGLRAAQRSEPSDERPRISGTVRVPGGIPAGETVKVQAELFPESAGGGVRSLAVLVASDGSFVLAVPEGTEHARLSLEARFLSLPSRVKARPWETRVLLDPCVYAAIHGEVVPPQSPSTLGVSWADMEVSWSLDPRSDAGGEAWHCASVSPSRDWHARPDHDGYSACPSFPRESRSSSTRRIRSVPSGSSASDRSGSDGFASSAVTLTPGQPASVDLRFERPDPVLLRGRVTRASKPVQCNLGLLSRGFAVECSSGADGRFEVTLQRPGDWGGAVWLASESFSMPDLGKADVRRFEVSVPDADEHAFELDFDALPRLSAMEELLR